MRKVVSKFAIIGVTALTISGLANVTKLPNKIEANIQDRMIKGYSHNVSNMLDNVFTENNTLILPYIYSFEELNNTLTEEKIREHFANANLNITNIITTNGFIGTGTKIVVDGNKEYTLLLYGDVNGDGDVDLGDAIAIQQHILFSPASHELKDVYLKAANLRSLDDDEADELTLGDATRIQEYILKKETQLIDEEPISDKEKDGIVSIAMESNPTTTTYNYGATSLDLTGAKIKATWKSGNEDIIDITSTMVSGYDFNTPGEHTVTVTHAGQQTSFTIVVLEKIKELELTDTGKTDADKVAGGYKVETQKEFILGTLKSKELTTGNVSTLTNEQVKIEKLSISSGDGATLDDLTIITELDSAGNILVKGTIAKEGTYSAELYINYGQEKIALPVQIVAEKNPVIAKITLEKIEDTDVDEISSTKSVKRKLVIENSKGEIINNKVNNIEFTNATSGLEFIKLNANGQTATAGETVQFVQIATSLEPDADIDAKFTIKVTGTKNSKLSGEIGLIIKEKGVVSNVNTSTNDLNLYDTETGEGYTESDGNIYTMFDLEFTDQYGNPINVTRDDIDEKYEIPSQFEAGKVYIILPLVNIKIDIGGGNTITEESIGGLLTKYYDENGNIAEGSTVVKKMAIAINLTGSDEVIKESITGKTLKIVVKDNQTIEEIQLEYKPTV